MDALGLFHTIVAVIALAAGAAVLLYPKGTVRHRWLGWAYVGNMVSLNASALWIYNHTGHFGPFHVAAVASLGTIAVGMWAVIRRSPRDRWLERHYSWMSYSYIGLVAAAAAEVMTRVQLGSFWWVVTIVSAAVMLVGGAAVRRRGMRELRYFALRPPATRSAC